MVMHLQFLDKSNDYQVFKDGWSGWVPEVWLYVSPIPSAGRNQTTGILCSSGTLVSAGGDRQSDLASG